MHIVLRITPNRYWMLGVAFEVISPTPRACPEEVGKGRKKGDFRRETVAILY